MFPLINDSEIVKVLKLRKKSVLVILLWYMLMGVSKFIEF